MDEQKNISHKGGTMRLGSFPCDIQAKTKAFQVYKANKIFERHRHRYEFNNKFKDLLQKRGLVTSGICKERNLVEIIELPDHPWFVGVQFHPEFKSRPMEPHPLFKSFVKAALEERPRKKETREMRVRAGRAERKPARGPPRPVPNARRC